MIDRITVWVCDDCGYWREDGRPTAVHMTANPDDSFGGLVRHPLRETVFLRAPDSLQPEGEPDART